VALEPSGALKQTKKGTTTQAASGDRQQSTVLPWMRNKISQQQPLSWIIRALPACPATCRPLKEAVTPHLPVTPQGIWYLPHGTSHIKFSMRLIRA